MTTLSTPSIVAAPERLPNLTRELVGSEPERLRDLRLAAAAHFDRAGFPTTREEEWRFTNLAPIARAELFPAELQRIDAAEIAPFAFADCHQVVVVNGRVAAELSELDGLPDGVLVGGLAEALIGHRELVEPWLARYADFEGRPSVSLNTAFFEDGCVVVLPKGVVVEKPIHILVVGVPEARTSAAFPRNLIVAAESSQATIIEQFATIGEGAYLTAPVTEVSLAANAVVDHYKLQRESTEAFHLATMHVELGRDGNFSSHSISWGGGLVRNDVHAVLAGEGCEATLNGLYMVEGTQLIDHHMRVEHVAAHCDSHELYKGILEGRSRAVFSGRIYVHKGAQKTDAKQTNRNLLLSKQAVCNSNPQLEIFADDVKCTHGSTVGQLDETAIFYLRSRGIGEDAAKSLLTYAFAVDIVERVKVPAVRRELEEFLFRRLPRGEVVRQAV
jgi:Fe-S cluster assembly protein SufD